jgi:death-on-curing protein
MKLLTLEQILELHVLAIRSTGGSHGIRDLGRLESAVAAQTQEVFGEEIYKGIFEKAAAMCRGVIADHPFVDGNKRTGMLVALTFLELNGHMFVAKSKELEDFAVNVAIEHLEIPEIAIWLKSHTKKR